MSYGYYKNGTEAWYADQEAKKCKDGIDQLVQTIDDQENEIEELKEERDDLQEELDSLEQKVEALPEPTKIIELMDQVETAGAALIQFAVDTRMKLRRAYALEEETTGDSPGAGGDGDDKNRGDEADGSTSTEGITRPQVP